MKKSIYTLLNGIGNFFSWIVPLAFLKGIKICLNKMRSGYYQKKFKNCGAHFNIEKPFFLVGGESIEIGDNFSAFGGLRLEAYKQHIGYSFNPSLVIGNHVSMNYDCHIACCNSVSIGDGVLIASKVFITDHFHGSADAESILLPPAKRKLISKGPVVIEENVWIGESVAIMPGVTIGANSIIGANAVVTKSFPANSVIGGNPAKLLKTIS